MIALFALMIVSCIKISPPPITPSETIVEPTQTALSTRHESITRWLSGTACVLPCWEHITLGKTWLEEAALDLAELADVRIAVKENDRLEWNASGYYYGIAVAAINNNTVAVVNLSFNSEQNISLQEAIEVYGYPTYIQLLCSEGLCETNLIYPDKGMAIRLFLARQAGNYVVITEHSKINGLLLFVPGIDNYTKMADFKLNALRIREGLCIYLQ